MAKTTLGIDIGSDCLKLALVSGGRVRKGIVVPMPKNLVREGRVVSVETMGELLRKTLRENAVRCSRAAIAMPNETVFVRGVTMPLMTVDQLNYNLPFEFRDYITEELKDYYYDYAVISVHEGGEEQTEGGGPTMELMAVAAPKAMIEEARGMLHKAGLKLVRAAPSVSCYQALIHACTAAGADPAQEYCILDLGYQAIRMYLFRGEQHMVTRVLEIGLNLLDQVLADAYRVDEHLAHTYLLTNYEDCQNREECLNAYENIAVELTRALNFYRFSNPDSHLENIWVSGGGACIQPLWKSISDSLDLKVHTAEELIPGGDPPEQAYALLQAIGIALD